MVLECDAIRSEEVHSTSQRLTKKKDTSLTRVGEGQKALRRTTLCDQREVLVLVALFISGFDMVPAGGHKNQEPTTLKTNPDSVQMCPGWDVDVEIRNGKEARGIGFVIDIRPTEQPFEMME